MAGKKEQERFQSQLGHAKEETRGQVTYDLPDPRICIPLSGKICSLDVVCNDVSLFGHPKFIYHALTIGKAPHMVVQNGTESSDKSAVQTSQTYPESVTNVLRAKKSRNYSNDTPCKCKFCYGYIGDGEDDELINVEPRSTATSAIPAMVLLSRGKHKQINDL